MKDIDENEEPITKEDESGSEVNEDFDIQALKKTKKIKKIDMKSAIQEVLQRQTKQENPILSKFRVPLKQTKKELKEKKLIKQNQLEKQKKRNIGHYIPEYEKDRKYELNLKTIAIKGVTKLFNAIKEYQKNNKTE